MTDAPLDALRDIHLPPEPALWPPAPGWWLVVLAVALLAALAFRRHRRGRALREALRELEALAAAHRSASDPIRLARSLSQLLRRYALARFPNAGIAGLTGDAWLQFLDEHGGAGRFNGADGALLASLPYRDVPPDALPAPDALIALVRGWLCANRR